ncbi:MAG: ABC transporter ATP-binding protein [Tissierellales bacterium]|jgi:ATP-binding cassette subfamily B protein|nr:ABC transporter ATP-binding protein [Tissierellales bacterium]HCX03568.1 ABC transporter ATP-binding protein [Clostridiales bacterium]
MEIKEKDYDKKLDLKTWKRLFKYLFRYKYTTIGLIIFMISLALADAVLPQMTRIAIDDFIIPNTTEGLDVFILKFVGLAVWFSSNVFAFIAIAGRIEMELTYDIREEAFDKLQKLSLSYYDKTQNGWIMARMTSDIRRLGEVISWGIVDVVWGTTMMLIISIFMLVSNWRLALYTLAVIPILIIVSIYFQRIILKAYRIVRKINSKITGSFSEGISGAKTTKTLVAEEKNLNNFKELTGDMKTHSIRAAVFSAMFLPIVLSLSSIGIALILWKGGEGVVAGSVTYGVLVLFISYATQFFEPVREVARVLAQFQQAQASAERVLSLIDIDPDVKDGKEILDIYGDILEPKKENWEPIEGNISFEDVTFYYNEKERILENFNLEVKKGQTIALVGETGSGKSTIVNLICRFYEPVDGKIKIDGIDYKKRSINWLHENIGYVLQSPHLFSGTIKENLMYGKLDATDEEVVEAAKIVNAHDFIMELPNKYETQVGEGGGKLSTGEKQLISFGRAIIRNPSIFVLDEATSSIDTETERKIQSALERILKDRTSFIIAHRLSTIVNADRILVISKGKIIEEGNHNQLIRKKGYYYNLYSNQFKKENLEKSII